jgi:hypothetical protein
VRRWDEGVKEKEPDEREFIMAGKMSSGENRRSQEENENFKDLS